MIHPKKPNCLIVNPYTDAGRKLIASSKPKYAPSRGYKNNTPSLKYKHKDYGIASDYLKKKNKEVKK